ncbi:hypothetical protein A11A3_12425 [Alcanivorax hongdengensis A-11-3]|uniref:EamA domain-containing protein n=1 Tax=Alcanivorax hongdengensis A-11-3 TaxID=1177179 RepID=L0W9K7_9GAMM|nr:DMT family transporter [Alcanivorax hongdengensis]EKF73646.1 hypothetical protein A11A3_12425 [Alcanivorax hongdengensis A-11-3]
MNPLTVIWALIVLSTLFWGSNFNAAHALASDLPALTAAAERFALAVLVFLLFRLWAGKPESRLRWRDAGVLIPLGVLGVFGFNYAFFVALQTTSALNAALIMALSPLVSVLLSVVLLNARINRAQVAGIVLAFAGVTLVITGGHVSQLHVAVGDLWMLMACLVWSLYSVGAKRYAPQIPPMQFARWTVSIGAGVLIAAALLLETPLTTLQQVPMQTHGLLLYMAICGSVLAYVFWLKGVHAIGPDKAAIAFNLVPVFTLLVNLLLGTLPEAAQLAGLVMVLAGVLVFNGKLALLLPTRRRVQV